MQDLTHLSGLIDRFAQTRVLVVGDLILDRFVYGSVDRISPESPVPVLLAAKESLMLGGAGNVAANLRGLGVATTLVSLTGDDAQAGLVADLCKKAGLATSGLVRDAARPTTIKTRFLAGHQQMLRVDAESAGTPSAEIRQRLLAAFTAALPGQNALILSDYGKGVLDSETLKTIIALARAAGIPVLVDPKGSDYTRYRGAAIVTPNRKELSEAVGGSPCSSDSEIEAASRIVIDTCGIEAVVATRSQDGMSVIEPGRPVQHMRTRAIEVFDVSGAGDTVIATIAASIGAGASLQDAANLANLAGGIVVAKVGTAAIREQDLRDALGGIAGASLKGWQEATEQVRSWQAKGLKVGFTNGCFDILHAGHVTYLAQARALCDRLVVGLNHDASVRLLKGPARPVNTEADRATVMGALASVDLVVLFGADIAGADNTPCALLDTLQPDLFFKGGDYTIDQLPEAKVVQAYGGEVRLMGLVDGLSTTNTIKKLSASKVA